MKLTNTLQGIALALATTCLTANAAFSQDTTVLLKSLDGSASLTGQLINFDDGFYTVESELGRFRVSSARMTCEGAGCPVVAETETDIAFVGSDTVGRGLMPLLLTGYANSLGAQADLRTGIEESEVVAEIVADDGFGDTIGTYLVDSKSSSDAFPALLNQEAEIGMSTRRISREEAQQLRAAGAGNMVSAENEHVIAVDSLVVILHPNNPVDTLSIEQLGGIYAGTITNWYQVGGPDLAIEAYTRNDGSGTRSLFENVIYGDGTGSPSDAIQEVDSDNDMAAGVNTNQGAIGYVGFAFQRGAKPVNITNTCGITSAPTSFSAKTEEYPMGRRLYMYNRTDNLSGDAKNFLNYALSQDADGVIAKSGFIDLGVERVSQDFTGSRMQDLITNTTDPYELGLMRELLVDMLQWDRVSTTLRFRTGSSSLSQKAINDVGRLVEYLADFPEGTEVALVGFTDSDGAFEANRSLSVERARAAANAVERLSEGRLSAINFVSKGFGELSPTACNTNITGKAANRRVEIWVRSPK